MNAKFYRARRDSLLARAYEADHLDSHARARELRREAAKINNVIRRLGWPKGRPFSKAA